MLEALATNHPVAITHIADDATDPRMSNEHTYIIYIYTCVYIYIGSVYTCMYIYIHVCIHVLSSSVVWDWVSNLKRVHGPAEQVFNKTTALRRLHSSASHLLWDSHWDCLHNSNSLSPLHDPAEQVFNKTTALRRLHSSASYIYIYIYIYICRYIHIQCNSKIHVSSGSAGYGTGTTHADICLLCFLFAYGLAASSYLHMGFLTLRVSLAQGPGPGFPDRHWSGLEMERRIATGQQALLQIDKRSPHGHKGASPQVNKHLANRQAKPTWQFTAAWLKKMWLLHCCSRCAYIQYMYIYMCIYINTYIYMSIYTYTMQ